MNICGGRGLCEYCNEWHDNVALHSAHYCPFNPNYVEQVVNYNIKEADEETYRLLGIPIDKNPKIIYDRES